MTAVGRATWSAVAVVIGAVGLWLDPVIASSAAILAGRGALVAGAVLLAQTTVGGAVLHRHAPAVLDRPGALGNALMVGVGVHALALLPLLLAGICTGPAACTVLVTALLSALLAPGFLARLRAAVRPGGATDPALPSWVWLLVAALLLPALADALAPATDTDELSYLLAIPHLLARDGTVPVGILLPEAGRPLPLQLVAVGTWWLGGGSAVNGGAGEAACRLWHLGVVGVLFKTVADLVRARSGDPIVAVLALAGSWSVVREAGLAYNDLPVALWLVCAADALLARRWRLLGLHAGFAFAAKYNAAPVCAALFAVAGWEAFHPTADCPDPPRTQLRRLLVAVGIAALPISPWWIRNALAGVHPLFPFAGWAPVPGMDFVFVYPQKYGLGHGWIDAVLLPFNLLFRAEPETMVYYGRLSLLWVGLLAIPLRASSVARRLAAVGLVGVVGWAMGAQILRYLLPVLGIGAMLLGTARLPRFAWVVLFVASLPANLAPAWTRAASEAAVATGREDADTYLGRALPMWPALRYARTWIPAGEKVALLGNWGGYYVDEPYVLGSVEDHVPTRYWLALHGDDALHALGREGVRWLVVGDLPTVRKAYFFLEEGTFEQQFKAPAAQLDRLLLRDARRVYLANHTAVWELDAG